MALRDVGDERDRTILEDSDTYVTAEENEKKVFITVR